MGPSRIFFEIVGLLLVVVWGVAAQDVSSDEFVPGVLRVADAQDVMFEPEPECGAGLTVCIGCKTVKVCVGSVNPVQECPKSTPYCNSDEGGCSSVPSGLEICADAGVEFTCTGEGIYPNPYSCNSYYYCAEKDVNGDLYTCPPEYTFNSRVQLCQRLGSLCKPVGCNSTNPIFNVYPSNSQYFSYCQYDDPEMDATKIMMFSCGTGATFDGSKCNFRCTREGMFAKSTDPTVYYQCYRSNFRLTAREVSCPPGKKFDATKKICLGSTAVVRRRYPGI